MTEINSVLDPEFSRLIMQSRALRSVADNPAGHRKTVGVEECNAVEQHAYLLMWQQPTHSDDIDLSSIRIGISDVVQVNPIGDDENHFRLPSS